MALTFCQSLLPGHLLGFGGILGFEPAGSGQQGLLSMKQASQCPPLTLTFCINGASELIVMNQVTGQQGWHSCILWMAKSSTWLLCPVLRSCYLFFSPEASELVFWILLAG